MYDKHLGMTIPCNYVHERDDNPRDDQCRKRQFARALVLAEKNIFFRDQEKPAAGLMRETKINPANQNRRARGAENVCFSATQRQTT